MLDHADIAAYDVDLFSPVALRQPFEHYRAMRDMAPVVQLQDSEIYALPRFYDVRDALQSSGPLSSAQGVGFSDAFNRPGAPNIIMSDGDLHRRLRTEVMRPLLPNQLRQHRDYLKTLITERIRALVDHGPFDAMTEIARFLPVTAISVFVGLPEEGRASMLEWAAAVFNALGPERDDSARDFKLAGEARRYIASLTRDTVREGSWAHTMFNAIESGKLTEVEALGALSAYVLPSLDTTILAKGHLLANLANNPDQWARLRQDPSLIPSAVLEGVRHSSVIRWFSRKVVADYRVGGYVVPEGARLMVMYASANRDERHFTDPARFDITRDARSHLAWGSGSHLCVGMHLAKLEMEVMTEALVENCAVLVAGEPALGANCGLYGFTTLPFELQSAG